MNGRVLLVDDSPTFIEMEKELLRDSQVELLDARDGQEALYLVKTKRPHLVFLDLLMPNMDGASCCRAIRSDAAIRKTPVVMVSSRGSDADKDKCFSAGCDYYLTKPLDRDLFLDVARRFIPTVNRRIKRMPVDVSCTVRVDNANIPCTLDDVSIGGAFVVTDYFARPGSVVEIAITLPDGTSIACQGTITWTNRVAAKKRRGFGVRFDYLPPRDYAALTRLIDPGN